MKNIKKIILCNKVNSDDNAILVNNENIEKMVNLGSQIFYIMVDIQTNNIETTIQQLNQYFENYKKRYTTLENNGNDKVEILEGIYKNYFQKITFEAAPDLIDYSQKILFDADLQEFTDITDYDTVDIYNFWDGHNWKYIEIENKQELTLLDNYISLDRWDGSKFTFTGNWNHGSVYKILEIDGDGEQIEDYYLLWEYNQHEGTFETGKIMSFEDLTKYLQVDIYANIRDFDPAGNKIDKYQYKEELEAISNL